MISQDDYEAARAQKQAAEKIIGDFLRQESDRADARWRDGPPFQNDELIYAATCRCGCGHGMAHPKQIGSVKQWNCSAVLCGFADRSRAHDVFPFAYYEIESEIQPSANGQTTRPAS